jgi:hypothetical protein
LDNLDDDEVSNLTNSEVKDFDVPNRGLSIVTESGLYSLIFRSRKPEAKRFRKWVTSEVLPSIRRTGSYEALPQDAIAGRVYTKLAGAENMPIKRINKLMYLYSVEPPILQADIARIIGVSDVTLTGIRKRFTQEEIRMFVKELRINALGCSENYVEAYSRHGKKAPAALPETEVSHEAA